MYLPTAIRAKDGSDLPSHTNNQTVQLLHHQKYHHIVATASAVNRGHFYMTPTSSPLPTFSGMCYQVQVHAAHHATERRGLRARNGNFIWKVRNHKDGGLLSQRTILPELELSLLLC